MDKAEGAECQPQEASGRLGAHRRRRLQIGLALLVAAILIAVVVGAIWRGVTLEDLRDRREAFTAYVRLHPVLSVEIYILAYFAVVAFSLPGALIMSLSGGYLFGVVEGTLAAVTGATLGAVAMYAAARWAMGDALRRRFAQHGGLAARLQAGVENNAFLALLSLRLIPGLPFGLVNLAAAAARIGFATYLTATIAGILPSTIVYVWIGHDLTKVLSRNGVPKLSKIIQPEVFLPLIGLFLLAAAPLAWKAWRARRPPLAGSDVRP